MLAVFSGEVVEVPAELVAAGSRTPSPKTRASELVTRFLGSSEPAVSVQLAGLGHLAYSHTNQALLRPRYGTTPRQPCPSLLPPRKASSLLPSSAPLSPALGRSLRGGSITCSRRALCVDQPVTCSILLFRVFFQGISFCFLVLCQLSSMSCDRGDMI